MNPYLRPSTKIGLASLCLAMYACAGGAARQPEALPHKQVSEKKENALKSSSRDTGHSVELQRLYAQAVAALRQNRDADAERDFKQIVKAQPDYTGPYANLAVLYRKQGRLDDAERVLVDALARNPKRVEYLNLLGVVKRQQGQFEAAAHAYERCLDVDQSFADAHYNLGILYDLYLRDYPKAVQHYQQFLRLTGAESKEVRVWLDDLKARMHASGD
ncbi:MAG: tetratricopeptide repeat protein [Gammaproteobacteria bacterium]|nr:tetratricopeptide repeat protein [Gammaproteobacteria bacterium]